MSVAGYDRSSIISVWMWDLFGWWKFCCEAHCPAVTNCHTGPGLCWAVLGQDGNNNQQLVRKTESGGLPWVLLSAKIQFTLLRAQSPLQSYQVKGRRTQDQSEEIAVHSMGKLRLRNPLQCNAVRALQSFIIFVCGLVDWWTGGLVWGRDVWHDVTIISIKYQSERAQ